MKNLFFILVLTLISSPALADRKCLVDAQSKITNCIAILPNAYYTPPHGTELIDGSTKGEPGGSYDKRTENYTKAPDRLPTEKSEIELLKERIEALEKK